MHQSWGWNNTPTICSMYRGLWYIPKVYPPVLPIIVEDTAIIQHFVEAYLFIFQPVSFLRGSLGVTFAYTLVCTLKNTYDVSSDYQVLLTRYKVLKVIFSVSLNWMASEDDSDAYTRMRNTCYNWTWSAIFPILRLDFPVDTHPDVWGLLYLSIDCLNGAYEMIQSSLVRIVGRG